MKYILLIILSLPANAFVLQKNKTLSIGAGLVTQDVTYEDRQDGSISVIPLISLKYNHFRIRGSSIKYNFTVAPFKGIGSTDSLSSLSATLPAISPVLFSI